MSKPTLYDLFVKLLDPYCEGSHKQKVDLDDLFNYFSTDDLQGLYDHLESERE